MSKYEPACIHFIETDSGEMVNRAYLQFVPRKGDELRLAEDKYFVVEQVVWVYDELKSFGQRVNIGVRKVTT